MEGLFILIGVFIVISNLAAKQRQNQNRSQGGMKRQPSVKREWPMQQWTNNKQQTGRTSGDIRNSWREKPEDTNEGIEIEDRSRTGSLEYIEQSYKSEGAGYQFVKPEQEKRKEKKIVPQAEIKGKEEEAIFDLTEDNLIRSIIMAEVLGPPRAMKRNIR